MDWSSYPSRSLRYLCENKLNLDMKKSNSKAKIYTKSGDGGTTSLFGGSRIAKDSQRIETIGAIDELNASLGVAEIAIKNKKITDLIARVQNELFNIGASLADPDKLTKKLGKLSDFDSKNIEFLESVINELDSQLPHLRNFILPSGSEAGSRLHHSRSICRRAEREVVRLSKNEKINPDFQIYLNRLSDLLFVLARTANKQANQKELFWEKY